jgi:hypothetical protein
MRDRSFFFKSLEMAVSAFALGAFFVAPLLGQTDLQIMVNGPWNYVEDPKDSTRVIVIAPITTIHNSAEIFSGDDATQFSGKRVLESGIFYFNVSNRTFPSKTSTANPYPLTVADHKVIVNEVYNHTVARWAISLPKPDYYETYKSAKWSGTSLSIISPTPITTSGAQANYTTWMVLHYSVNNVAPATFTGSSDDGTVTHNDTIPFTNTSGGTNLGVSIVTMAKDSNNDRCDGYSTDSFRNNKALWSIATPLYALFPTLDVSGNVTGTFDYNCPQMPTQEYLQARMKAREIPKQVQQIREYLEDPERIKKEHPEKDAQDLLSLIQGILTVLFTDKLPTPISRDFKIVDQQIKKATDKRSLLEAEKALTRIDQTVWPFTAGGGDCHMAQINVNSVVR